MDFITPLIVSVGYLGYVPLVPGTMGSLAGLTLAWFLNSLILPLALFLNLIGLLFCRPAIAFYGKSDPQKFVLDETGGMLLSLVGIPPNAILFMIGFTLFRSLDNWKPWPIILLQNSKSPYSIMWDDLVAGIITNGVLQVLIRICPGLVY